MNALDIAVAALCLVLALFGLFHGFVRQVASWTGLILGHIAGVKYNAAAQKALHLDFTRGDIAAYLLVLLAVYIAVRLAGLLVERWVRGTKLSGTDRLFGALAGLAKGILLSVLLVFILIVVLPRDAALLKGSKAAPRLMVAVRWMEGIFPDRIREAYREKTGAPAQGSGGEKEDGPLQPKKRPRK